MIPRWLIIALFVIGAFYATVELLDGPLKPYVPTCTPTTIGFCVKR